MTKNILRALAALIGFALLAPAYAVTICPPTLGLGPAGGGGPGNATDCNLFITFNADGSITTTNGPQTTYDSIDDALIGVINNTGHTISSFSITGAGVFGFEFDGVNTYTGVVNTAGDTSVGYGGKDAFFTGIDVTQSHGTVNFGTAIAANGGTDYFSLEQAININQPPVVGAPEPATSALLALGFLGVGLGLKRRRR